MSNLHIIYDPTEKLVTGPSDDAYYTTLGIKVAVLSIADDIEAQDIYAIARKLAELLLEQLRSP